MEEYKPPQLKLEKIDPFAKQEKTKQWLSYKIRDEQIWSESTYNSRASNIQKISFDIPKYGLLNKLVIKHELTHDTITGANQIIYASLALLDKAILYCGKDPIFQINGYEILSQIQMSSVSDKAIYKDACRDTFSGALGTDNLYTPLLFGCFESFSNLLDCDYLQPLRIEVYIKPLVDVINASGLSNVITLLSQHIVVDDYDAFYKLRYKGGDYEMLTHDNFTENSKPLTLSSTASNTQKYQLYCDKDVEQTYIFVAPNQDYMYMAGCQITAVKLLEQDKILHHTKADIENYLLHHTEYRKEPFVKDNSTVHEGNVYIIPHGIYSTIDQSNNIDMRDKFMYVELTFTPTTSITGAYNVYISHDYLKKIIFDEVGRVKNIIY